MIVTYNLIGHCAWVREVGRCALVATALLLAIHWSPRALSAEFRFKHHFIDRNLAEGEKSSRNCGLTALVDLDRDGDLDFVVGAQSPSPSRLYWYEFQAPDRWRKHLVGTNYLSDVGLTALDVDGDGWPDLVCSGVWYRNTGKPREEEFQRLVFDPQAGGAHDVLAADMDGDGKIDIVMMGDEKTKLNSLRWYSIPEGPTSGWEAHLRLRQWGRDFAGGAAGATHLGGTAERERAWG